MLTPQGRFYADIFFVKKNNQLYMDLDESSAEKVLNKLNMYKLRKSVNFFASNLKVFWEKQENENGLQDPRSANIGYRLYMYDVKNPLNSMGNLDSYTRQRYMLNLAEPNELIMEKSIPLEFRMDEFQAISWKKGCYVGQELTARTKHVGEVRKKTYGVRLPNNFVGNVQDAIMADDKKIGSLIGICGSYGLAMLRTEAIDMDFVCNNQLITRIP